MTEPGNVDLLVANLRDEVKLWFADLREALRKLEQRLEEMEKSSRCIPSHTHREYAKATDLDAVRRKLDVPHAHEGYATEADVNALAARVAELESQQGQVPAHKHPVPVHDHPEFDSLATWQNEVDEALGELHAAVRVLVNVIATKHPREFEAARAYVEKKRKRGRKSA
ncbi:hypothetical protein H5T53_06825 [Candidatus Bipolaricaulota bacterium]|nr:hypothetical protein [Candidatus Bipolaricaulota bacterium]